MQYLNRNTALSGRVTPPFTGTEHVSATLCLVFFAFCTFAFLAVSPAFANSSQTHKGKASWYGSTAHGKSTANGEIFLRTDFSAAHKTLPFGTVVRVYNEKNGRQVLVRINDRGPYSKGRVIDLSKRAANNLHMIKSGVTRVVFEVVTDPKGRPLNPGNSFFIRLADTNVESQVPELLIQFQKKFGMPIQVFSAEKPHRTTALCAGPFATFQEAETILNRLDSKHEVKDIVEAPTKGECIPYYTPSAEQRSIVASVGDEE